MSVMSIAYRVNRGEQVAIPVAQAFRAITGIDNDTRSSIILSTPAGVQENDLLLAFMITDRENPTFTPPSGWTLADEGVLPNTDAPVELRLFWRRATANEPATHEWALGGAGWSGGTMVAYSGVATTGDPLVAVDTIAQQHVNMDLSYPAIAMAGGGLIVGFAYQWAEYTWQEAHAGAPWTNRERRDSSGIVVYDGARATADPTTGLTLRIGNATSAWAGGFVATLALPAAAGGGGPDLKSASDTLSVTLSDADALLASLLQTDSLGLTASEVAAISALLLASDSVAIASTETPSVDAVLQQNDILSVSVFDAIQLAISLFVADAQALICEESAATNVNVQGVESLTLFIQSIESIAAEHNVTDMHTLTEAENVTLSSNVMLVDDLTMQLLSSAVRNIQAMRLMWSTWLD